MEEKTAEMSQLGSISHDKIRKPGADPGFFLGGGVLVSCSTSTPINHIVFFLFRRIPVFIRKPLVISKGGGGGGVDMIIGNNDSTDKSQVWCSALVQ